MGVGRQHLDGLVQQFEQAAQSQYHTRQYALQQRRGVGAVAHAPTGGQIGLLTGVLAQQGAHVVGQHLGRHVHQQGVLREATDRFELGTKGSSLGNVTSTVCFDEGLGDRIRVRVWATGL